MAKVESIMESKRVTRDNCSFDFCNGAFRPGPILVSHTHRRSSFFHPQCALGTLVVGIETKMVYTPCELLDRGLAVDSGGIEGGMSKERGESNKVTRVLGEIGVGKGMTQRMRTGVLRNQPTAANVADHPIDHLTHGRRGERSAFLTAP